MYLASMSLWKTVRDPVRSSSGKDDETAGLCCDHLVFNVLRDLISMRPLKDCVESIESAESAESAEATAAA